MQFLVCNQDKKIMLGSPEQLLPLFQVLQELHLKLNADVLLIAPDCEQPSSCFDNLLPASPEHFNSLISDLRKSKVLAGPIVLFFDQILSEQIKAIICLFKFNYVYVTSDILYNFVDMSQTFELNSVNTIGTTFVFDFYKPSPFKENWQLPTKKQYILIKHCQMKSESKTDTKQDFEIIVRLIMNKETSLTKNTTFAEIVLGIEGAPPIPEPEEPSEQKSSLAENKLAIEGAPPTPEPEETSEQNFFLAENELAIIEGAPPTPEPEETFEQNFSLAENKLAIIEGAPPTPEPEEISEQKYEGRLNFDFRADEEVEKLRFLQGLDLVKKGTVMQKMEILHNTRSIFGSNKKSSKVEEKTGVKVEEAKEAEKAKKVSKSKKRPRSSESSGETPAKKRRCTSKRADVEDYKPISTRPKSSTGERSSYKKYDPSYLDYAVLEVLEGTQTALDAAEKHNVPSRTVYDRLKKLRDNEEDCGVSLYVWEIYQQVGTTRAIKRSGKSQKRQEKLAASA